MNLFYHVTGGYLLFVNLLAFIIYGIDKYKSMHNKWRIPEIRLLTIAIFGGSFGALMGMFLFHHKTRHLKFILGIPVILVAQLLLFVYLYFSI